LIFTQTPLQGAFVIEPEKLGDERGFFARTFCRSEFAKHGMNPLVEQCNVSFNAHRGTVRGLHYQTTPHQEAKLVCCLKGEIFDAIVDLRPESSSFKRYFAVILSAENRLMLYVPEGFAHGFQTLAHNTEVGYQMSHSYHPEVARGVRWNDPAFSIPWPEPCRVISDRDRTYPDFCKALGVNL
jgi:dTDP-4-dehydrorhamnose 3,5-epimerase